MERTWYRLKPVAGKEEEFKTLLELQEKQKALRQKNRGYYIYEVTETESRLRVKFSYAWNPRV